jgi:hypothetical protein
MEEVMRLRVFFAIILLSLATTFGAFSEELTPINEDCNVVVADLVKSYLEENDLVLSCFEEAAGKQIDINSLVVTERFDLNQGSFNLRRQTELRDANGNFIVLYTFGDLWCSNERILAIKEIK